MENWFSMLPWVLRDSRNIHLIKKTICGTIFVPFSIGEGFKKITRLIIGVHGYNLLQNEPSLAIFWLL